MGDSRRSHRRNDASRSKGSSAPKGTSAPKGKRGRSTVRSADVTLPSWLIRWGWWLIAPLAAVIAYRSVTGFEHVGDGRLLILDNSYMRGLEHIWGMASHNYFWSSSGSLVPYWRPVTKVSWLLEVQLFGDWAGGHQLVQLGWHLAAVVGVQRLALELRIRRELALIAGLVVALHPLAIAPVCMVMARSDVVAVACTIWAVIAWLRWRRDGDHRWRWAAAHVGCVLLALGSKETAAVLPALLAVWALLDGDLCSGKRRRLWRLLPSVIAVAVYLMLRTVILGREAEGLSSVKLGIDPLRLAACLGKYLTNLWALWLSSGVRDLPIAEARSGGFWLTAAPALLAGTAVAGLALWRRDRKLLFALAWIGAALAPVLLTAEIHVPAVQQKYPMADRWAYHALPSAALLWCGLVSLLDRRWLTRSWQLAAAGWAANMLWTSTPARAEFSSELAMLDNEDRAYYLATPEPFRTAEDHCRFEERKVERALRRSDDAATVAAFEVAIERCGALTTQRWMQLLDALLRLERYQRAEPVVRRLLGPSGHKPAQRAWLTRVAATVLTKTGRGREAEPYLIEALRLGVRDCRIYVQLVEIARARGDLAAASQRAQAGFRCGGERDPSLLFAAATWALDAGDENRARALLDGVDYRYPLSVDQRGQLGLLEARLRGDPAADASGSTAVYRGP